MYNINPNTKQNIVPTNTEGFPQKKDGRDGDIRINLTKYGVCLFTKFRGNWYYTVLDKLGG